MKKILLHLIIVSFILGCSNSHDINEESKLDLYLTLTNSNSFSSSFEYNFSPELENVKLIWNDVTNIDVGNKIGEKDITVNNTSIIVNNLEQNQSYSFRLTGDLNNKIYYSEIISLTTSEIQITHNDKIFNHLENVRLHEIIKTDDGYIFFIDNNPGIRISKTDNQFNELWSFNNIDYGFKGVHDLKNGEYVVFNHKFSFTSTGLYNNEAFGFKFNSSGEIIWDNNYSSDNMDANTRYDLIIPFTGKSK